MPPLTILKMNIKKKIIKARIRLLSEYPFFGRLCMLLDVKEMAGCPSMGTDGFNLYYNNDFVNSLSEYGLVTILAHEVLHLALGHIWRKDKRDQFRWNIATDYAVNLILEKNGFERVDGVLLDHKYEGMNAEKIYDELENVKTITFYSANEAYQQRENTGKPTPNCPTRRHKYWGTKEKEKLKNKVKGQREGLSDKDKSLLQKKWDAAISEAIRSSKDRGTLPAGLERLIGIVEARENWKEILASYLSYSFSDFDFMRQDRRMLGSPFYLPDLRDETSLEDLVVAFDTSGSIGPDELNQFLSEVKEISKAFPKVKGWMIECDAEVGRVMEIEKVNKIDNFTGGGGTSHVPVFHEIKKRGLNPRVLICFTDMYTDFPDEKPDFPVLWLVTPSGDFSSPPFGRLIKMRDFNN